MEINEWTARLHGIYESAVEKYRAGERGADTFFGAEDVVFLASIGLRPIHVYDFAEDFTGRGEPDWETFLLIAAARRDYFQHEMKGEWSGVSIRETDLPSKDATFEGIEWLPRIAPKAMAFLRGELPPEIMYCCGGDRKFFKARGIHPADFLRVAWSANGDLAKMAHFVKSKGIPALV